MKIRRNEYEILNQMLDDAIAGTFEENCFDESELSKLQTKFMRYLSTASMSEKKIQEEKDNLKELITNISHQTKTPLTNILMYSELLTEVAATEQEKEYAGEVFAQGKKLESLIEALVKMSRLETGIFQYQKKETAYREIIHKAVEQALPKASEKNISILVRDVGRYRSYVDEKWVIEAVYNILERVLLFILKNSLMSFFRVSGLQIKVSVYQRKKFLCCLEDFTEEGPHMTKKELVLDCFWHGRL